MASDKDKVRTAPEAREGTIFVTTQYGKTGEEKNAELKIEVRKFDVEPAYVRANYGLTINLGNYESARCDVSVTLPCYVEEVPAAFEKAWGIAKDQIKEQVKSIKSKGG